MDEGLIEIYKRLRPGEPPTVDSASQLLNSLFFDPKRYDLARVGRYKFNKKLSIASRINGLISADILADPVTGEVIVDEGEKFTRASAEEVQNAGINQVNILLENGNTIRIVGNNFVDPARHLDFDPNEVGINDKVHYPTLRELIEANPDEGDLKTALEE